MQKRLNEHFLICACCTCNTTQCNNWTYDIGAGITQAEMMFTPPRCNLLLSIAQTPWKVLKCRKWIHPAGVHFPLPLLAMPPGSWSNATTRNTLISTKGNVYRVYADPFVRTFLEPKAPQSITWNALLDLCNVICTATQLMCTCTWIQMRKCLSPRLGT